MKDLPEILALAREHMLNVNERVSGFTTSAPILTFSMTQEQLQSFVAAVGQRGYQRGLEDAANLARQHEQPLRTPYVKYLSDEIRAMKGSTCKT